MPDGAVFVDLFHYRDFQWDPKLSGRKEPKVQHALRTFIIRKDKDPIHVDLKEALTD